MSAFVFQNTINNKIQRNDIIEHERRKEKLDSRKILQIFHKNKLDDDLRHNKNDYSFHEFSDKFKVFEEVWEREISIQNDKDIDLLYQKRNINEILSIILIVTSIITAIIYHYFSIEYFKYNNIQNYVYLYALKICSVSNIAYLINLYLKYQIQLDINKFTKLTSNDKKIIDEGIFQFLLEALLFVIHPNILLDKIIITIPKKINTIDTTYYINSLLTIFSFLKLILIYKGIFKLNIFNSARSKRILIMKGYQNEDLFSMKCLLAKYTYYLLPFSLILIILHFSVALQIIEGDYQTNGNFISNSLSNFANCFWIVSISIATIGYGDVTPQTTLGRIICIFSVIFGTILLSLLHFSFTNYFNFDLSESKAYLDLQMCSENRKIMENFSKFFKICYKYNKLKREYVRLNKNQGKLIDSNDKNSIRSKLRSLLTKKLKFRHLTKVLMRQFNNHFHSNPFEEALKEKIIQSLKKEKEIIKFSKMNHEILSQIQNKIQFIKEKSEDLIKFT